MSIEHAIANVWMEISMKLKKMKKKPCNSSVCLRDLKKLIYLPIEKQSLEAETCGTSNESSTKNESLAI